MNRTTQLYKSFASLLLLIALMLPSAVQLVHAAEGHDHVVCTDQTTHMHESTVQCDVCSFQLTSSNYDVANYPDLVLPIIPVQNEVIFTSLQLDAVHFKTNQLRGPPTNS